MWKSSIAAYPMMVDSDSIPIMDSVAAGDRHLARVSGVTFN